MEHVHLSTAKDRSLRTVRRKTIRDWDASS
jgi:hypothetical protein